MKTEIHLDLEAISKLFAGETIEIDGVIVTSLAARNYPEILAAFRELLDDAADRYEVPYEQLEKYRKLLPPLQ